MKSLIRYKTLPQWNANNLPQAFRQKHSTKAGTWAKLEIFRGRLKYFALDETGQSLSETIFDNTSAVPYIEPQAWHRVEPASDDLSCQLSFYCQAKEYYQKKYKLTAPHSEVIDALNHIQTGSVLDLGCGRGRNSLYLQQRGFRISAFDQNPSAIQTLQNIIDAEGLNNINAYNHDANGADIKGDFDLIICTVVMMFLNGQRIPAIIDNMQASTKAGGYNLIVCPIDSKDYPLNNLFGFAFQPNELASYYQHWDIKKYNEDIGELHRLDENGNRIKLRFATLLAQKI